jgi:GTP-binding protein
MSGYSLERFSAVRSIKSIERCDIALIVLDANEGIADQDQKIAGIVSDYGKGAVFLLNKWDLLQKSDETYKALLSDVGRKMWFIQYAPVLTVSGLEKTRVTKVFPFIDEIIRERKKRIPTAELNRVFTEIQSKMTLPSHKGKPVRLNYITQVKTEPPSFTVFANYPDAIKDAYIRHIEKILRNRFSFRGTPIRIYVKERSRRS